MYSKFFFVSLRQNYYQSRNIFYMIRNIFPLILVVLLNACMSSTDDSNGIKVGDKLPSFEITLTVVDSADWRNTNEQIFVTSEQLVGKRNIIVFFSTTCPDCQKELPVIQQLYDKVKSDARYSLLCISREESRESVEKYWQEHSLTLPYSPQDDRKIYSLFATSVIPRIYITDTTSTVTHIHTDNPLATLQELLNEMQF